MEFRINSGFQKKHIALGNYETYNAHLGLHIQGLYYLARENASGPNFLKGWSCIPKLKIPFFSTFLKRYSFFRRQRDTQYRLKA